MKIAITGHSKGLGAEFKKHYESQGHTVVGFSRSNGYDLQNWAKMQNMLEQIKDFDMLISCAKPNFTQTTLLYELFKLWYGQDKIILNISSILTYYPTNPRPLFDDPMMDLYRNNKLALNEACRQLSFKSNLPKIVLVKPGHLYSSLSAEEQQRLTAWVKFLTGSIEQAQSSGFFIREITLD